MMKERPILDKKLDSKTFRDFFADNQGKSLEQAIKCWKYKKQLPGHNRYEKCFGFLFFMRLSMCFNKR